MRFGTARMHLTAFLSPPTFWVSPVKAQSNQNAAPKGSIETINQTSDGLFWASAEGLQ
jgi:hypothetical protein